jgi:hypothetical protein
MQSLHGHAILHLLLVPTGQTATSTISKSNQVLLLMGPYCWGSHRLCSKSASAYCLLPNDRSVITDLVFYIMIGDDLNHYYQRCCFQTRVLQHTVSLHRCHDSAHRSACEACQECPSHQGRCRKHADHGTLLPLRPPCVHLCRSPRPLLALARFSILSQSRWDPVCDRFTGPGAQQLIRIDGVEHTSDSHTDMQLAHMSHQVHSLIRSFLFLLHTFKTAAQHKPKILQQYY